LTGPLCPQSGPPTGGANNQLLVRSTPPSLLPGRAAQLAEK